MSMFSRLGRRLLVLLTASAIAFGVGAASCLFFDEIVGLEPSRALVAGMAATILPYLAYLNVLMIRNRRAGRQAKRPVQRNVHGE